MKTLMKNIPFVGASKVYCFVIRYLLGTFAVFSAAFILIKFPSWSASGVKSGIEICFNRLIPSLYPFMILTNYFALSEACKVKTGFLDKLCRFLFRLPGCCCAVIAFSLVGGLPVGAKMSVGLYERGLISKEQCRRMLCFCVNPGPAFVISAVGVSMLGSKNAGITIYISLVISSLIIGFATRFFSTDDEFYISSCSGNSVASGTALETAIVQSSKALLGICSWVVAFSCLNEIIFNLDMDEGIKNLILCTSEMTNGSLIASECFSVPIVAAVIGFGGFCGHFQLMNEIKKAELKYKYFLVSRIINSGLSAVFCSFLLKCFPVAEETFAVGIKPDTGENSGSFFLSVMMLLMAVLFLVGDDYKVSRKNTKKL